MLIKEKSFIFAKLKDFYNKRDIIIKYTISYIYNKNNIVKYE